MLMSEKESPVKLGRPKSEEKRQTILSAASSLFLSNGFTNTSMDMVAKKAGVSKQTVYSHFNNKDELYTAVIDAKCQEYRLDASQLAHRGASLRQVLMILADQVIGLLQDPDVIAMYTVVIGEAKNNPHVAELFYTAGPLQSVDTVASIIINCAPRKLDERQAKAIATDFFNLIKGDFHMRSMLNLSFCLSEDQKSRLCERVCTQIIMLLDNINHLPDLLSSDQ